MSRTPRASGALSRDTRRLSPPRSSRPWLRIGVIWDSLIARREVDVQRNRCLQLGHEASQWRYRSSPADSSRSSPADPSPCRSARPRLTATMLARKMRVAVYDKNLHRVHAAMSHLGVPAEVALQLAAGIRTRHAVSTGGITPSPIESVRFARSHRGCGSLPRARRSRPPDPRSRPMSIAGTALSTRPDSVLSSLVRAFRGSGSRSRKYRCRLRSWSGDRDHRTLTMLRARSCIPTAIAVRSLPGAIETDCRARGCRV